MSDGSGGGPRRDLTVLFVDDYPEYVAAGEEYLETVDDRMTVIPVTSAEAALERIESGRVDCVVCDYEMPGMSGIDLLAAVREERPELPVILLTGHEPERVEAGLESGSTDVLQKGSGTHTFEEVRTQIRELVPARAGFHFDNVTG